MCLFMGLSLFVQYLAIRCGHSCHNKNKSTATTRQCAESSAVLTSKKPSGKSRLPSVVQGSILHLKLPLPVVSSGTSRPLHQG